MLNCIPLFVTTWTIACQSLSSMEFSRQEYWSRLPFPSPGYLPDPGIEPASLLSPALTGAFLPLAPPGTQQGPAFLTLSRITPVLPSRKASLVAQMVKNLPAMQETWVLSLGWEDPLGKEMATHSSILAWRIPWTEEPGKATVHGIVKSQIWWSYNTSAYLLGTGKQRSGCLFLKWLWSLEFWILKYEI